MIDQLIEFDTAVLAKEKGFDNTVYGYNINQNRWFFKEGKECYFEWDYESESEDEFNEMTKNLIPRPSQSLLQKWLREKHNIQLRVHFNYGFPSKHVCSYLIGEAGKKYKVLSRRNSYEEALEKGLFEALKLI